MSATFSIPTVKSTRTFDAAMVTIIAAIMFNMVLCFLFTRGLDVGSSSIIALCELAITTVAFLLCWETISEVTYWVMFAMVCYLLALWLIRQGSSPKIVRDLLIPFVYFSLGATRGTPENGDRLVRMLLVVVLIVGLFEWFDLALFTKLFDIQGYYVAKGALSIHELNGEYTGTSLGLFMSGTRAEGRSFLPFLGPHRVSSVFLEPIELGAFSSITFAWLLCRFHLRPALTMISMLICLALIILTDSRFAAILCIVMVLFHVSSLAQRTAVLAALPIGIVSGLILLAFIWHPTVVEDNIFGRLYTSGSMLASFRLSEWLGLRESLAFTADAGYAYLCTYGGVTLAAILWVVFVLAAGGTPQARAVRGAFGLYATMSLCVGAGLFSIKASALMWYLYGAVTADDGATE